LDNTLLPCRFSRRRRQRAEAAGGAARTEAKRLLRALDMEEALWRQPAMKLSIGQQQRTAAARALLGRPELIVADEPTSSLDADRQAIFLELLQHECASSGAALLFVSHDERLAGCFARRLHLIQGQKTGDGRRRTEKQLVPRHCEKRSDVVIPAAIQLSEAPRQSAALRAGGKDALSHPSGTLPRRAGEGNASGLVITKAFPGHCSGCATRQSMLSPAQPQTDCLLSSVL
ncbi:MAG: ATP-binding cassette domain-containing protein, partial [Zoogloeaceae bacterium]|nr:ATP-binding cassette domain-containing protein [Zoogloeaceae bacterium]